MYIQAQIEHAAPLRVPIFPPAYSAGDITIYLFTDATSHKRATPTSVCLLLRHDSLKHRRQRLQNLVFDGLIAPKLYIPHQNSCTKGTSPKWFPLPKIVPFELYPYHKHPLESTHFQLFLRTVKPQAQKFGNFSTVYSCAHQFTSFTSKMLKISAG